MVRACAGARQNESEFVTRPREHGVQVRLRYAEGGTSRVAGYSPPKSAEFTAPAGSSTEPDSSTQIYIKRPFNPCDVSVAASLTWRASSQAS